MFCLADLHCDAAYKIYGNKSSLASDKLEVCLPKANVTVNKYIQVFALFLHDKINPEDRFDTVKNMSAYFLEDAKKTRLLTHVKSFRETEETLNAGKCAGILSVENGSFLNGDVSRLGILKELGVMFFSLTWNADNELACGAFSKSGGGVTPLGRLVLDYLSQNGIAVDISHLNDKSAEDVLSYAKGPVVATHSNSRSVINHRRNLTDEQFCEIKRRGGLVGLNMYGEFLSGGESSSISDVFRHIEHFLSLGGEDVLAIGADFDGADGYPPELCGSHHMPALKDAMLKAGYSEELTDKICFGNAYSFLRRNF